MFNQIFKEGKIGSLSIKNRLIVPAMHSGSVTKEHLFSEQSINYFAARAKGGFGLIITEFLCISKEGLADETEAGIYDNSFIPNLSSLTKAIHDNGASCFAQLHHAGMQSDFKTTNQVPVGPSSIPTTNKISPVRELTISEIWELIDKFGDAAVRAKMAGFDGVEVHGAHGYLVAQFLSKSTNKRVDEFGGTNTGRAKFACEIIRNIKEKCGKEFPVSIRISAQEDMKNGNNIIDSSAQAILFENAGADLINVSVGTIESRTIIAPNYVKVGFNIENTKKIKECVSIPVVCVGRINDPSIAESIIASNSADFIAIGRQSICDPEFPNKVKENRLDEIFYCSACMQRCFGGTKCDDKDTGVSCMINPFSGKEGNWEIIKTELPKKILIVGAGPSGLQAAWILAKRGHQVILIEKSQTNGGQIKLASIPPMKHDLAKVIHTYESLCYKNGVEIIRGIEVTKEVLESYKSDTIILATGSIPLIPNIKGIENQNIYKANDILSGDKIINNQKVLVIGSGLVGCETAEFLSMYNNDITIVDMMKEMIPNVGKTMRKHLLTNLEVNNIKFIPETKVLEFIADGIKYDSKNNKGELNGYDSIILALGTRSHNPLLDIAEQLCNEVYSIGDAKQVSDAKIAIYEATKLALNI